ncbi:MAG: branched-chain amino acid ABC transporter permease, partial [Planctomycetes bacterium]|nr:branched-chain amino acid ABC transporter permease [Planctomycetota bacterium]
IMLVWGARYRAYPAGLLPNVAIPFAGQDIPLIRLAVLLASLGVMLGLYFFIHRTRMGAAIRAAAIDQGAAKLMGIDVRRVIALVFMIGPALGGMAGMMVGLYYGQINFNMGQIYGLKAFTAAIIGGIGNIPGAMIGGLLLGLVEAFGATYISLAWRDAITFLVLIVILVARPTGLLRERVAEKL